jgi:hypothetical protein
MTPIPKYTKEKAEQLGYASITLPFSNTPEDMLFFSNVLRDMVGSDHCIIETPYGPEVGRPKKFLL